jgi:hypothetical protein
VEELEKEEVSFDITGVPTTLVGLDFAFHEGCMVLNQTRYARSIAVGEGTVPAMPLPEGVLTEEDSSPDLDGAVAVKAYRSILGMYAYLQHTRPDLCFSISYLGKFSSKPTEKALRLLQNAVRFAQSTSTTGVVFPYRQRSGGEESMLAWCDASFGSHSGAYAHSGHLVMWNGCAIDWRSGRQRTVARSTLKAETSALHKCVDHVSVLAYFFRQLGMKLRCSLYSDSRSLVELLRAPHPHPGEASLVPVLQVIQKKMDGTTESMSDKELRDLVVPILALEGLVTHCGFAVGGSIGLKHVRGEVNPADVLTKPREVSLLSDLVTHKGSGLVIQRGSTQPGFMIDLLDGLDTVSEHDGILGDNEHDGILGDNNVGFPDGGGEELPVMELPGLEGLPSVDELGSIPGSSGEGEGESINDGSRSRSTRTGYGLRPSTAVRRPARLIFLAQGVLEMVTELLRGVPGVPGSVPTRSPTKGGRAP